MRNSRSDESDLNLAGFGEKIVTGKQKKKKGLKGPLVCDKVRARETLDLDTVDAPSAVKVLRLAGWLLRGC